MTPLEAHELTLEKVKELKSQGIKVKITPCKSRYDKETVKRFNQPERIPPEKWVNVRLQVTNKEDAQKIFEAANYLGMCGIQFDTGGCGNSRDWELDWSFKYTGEENEKWRDARVDLEDSINELWDAGCAPPTDPTDN